ncbi:MAG: hypothetical protein RSA29_03795 [Clostridium sp.]|uniref:hypothetical protein n=1 Tax=Clostridium sp. TaxID=1506 RepID=UPI0030371C1C
MDLYENLPKGYLEKRKKASLRFVYSIYAVLIIAIAAKYIKINELSFLNMLYYISVILSIIFMTLSHTTKTSFNNIPIPIYQEVDVFTKKSICIYTIPILLLAPFVIMESIKYMFILGIFYIGVKSMLRPMDAYDNKYKRHY